MTAHSLNKDFLGGKASLSSLSFLTRFNRYSVIELSCLVELFTTSFSAHLVDIIAFSFDGTTRFGFLAAFRHIGGGDHTMG